MGGGAFRTTGDPICFRMLDCSRHIRDAEMVRSPCSHPPAAGLERGTTTAGRQSSRSRFGLLWPGGTLTEPGNRDLQQGRVPEEGFLMKWNRDGAPSGPALDQSLFPFLHPSLQNPESINNSLQRPFKGLWCSLLLNSVRPPETLDFSCLFSSCGEHLQLLNYFRTVY